MSDIRTDGVTHDHPMDPTALLNGGHRDEDAAETQSRSVHPVFQDLPRPVGSEVATYSASRGISLFDDPSEVAGTPDGEGGEDSRVQPVGGRRSVDSVGLLDRLRPPHEVAPRQWWRKALSLGADEATIREAQDGAAMRIRLARPLTVAVAQTRGEASKTVTTFGLASALGVARGGGVVAWDNNEAPGNLADRVEREHGATMTDLLNSASYLMSSEATQVEVEFLLQHQDTGFFKVLAADDTGDHAINADEFATIHTVLGKYFPITVIDTGNSGRAANWKAAIHAADVIVVPIKLRPDHIVPAARMIRKLQDDGEELFERVILVVSCGPDDRHISEPEVERLFGDFGLDQFKRLDIPTDPMINSAAVLRWGDLAPATQAAYNHLGATVIAAVAEN